MTNKMKLNKSLTIISIGIIIGFCVGIISSLHHIMANRYIQYKMFILASTIFKKTLNSNIFYFVFILLVIYLLWFLFTEKLKPENRVKKLFNIFIVILALLLSTNQLLRSFTGYTFFPIIRGILARTADLFTGKIPFKDFFDLIIQYFIFAIIIFITIALIIFLFWLDKKTRWRKIVASIKNIYIKRVTFVLVLLLVTLNVGIFIEGKINTPKGTNIILISVDTLRADHLGCYGYKKETSPNLDKFASESLLFEYCFSHAPVTGSSCASILSGFLPHETKVYRNMPLPLSVNTIAEILRNYGYKTIAVVSNYVLHKRRGYEQGFDLYNDKMDEKELTRHIPERTAKNTTDCAIEFLKKYQKNKFFLWIHYQDPHGPYTPPLTFNTIFYNQSEPSFKVDFNDTLSGKNGIPSHQKLGENQDFNYYVSQYDGEIRYFDEHFKRVIEALKELKLYEDSLIMFTADHGEGMGEHNYFFAHGEYLYNSLIHVPLIVKYEEGYIGIKKDYVKHIDIIPTLLKITGIKTNLNLRGQNLLKKDFDTSEIFSEMKDRCSLIVNRIKLIYRIPQKEYLLFDLRTDLNEADNLINNIHYEETREQLKEKLMNSYKQDLLRLNIVNKEPRISKEEKEKLKALGYVK